MTDEIRKLLGGYATNTLTETERRILFEAAIDDQELFDALQKEQALRELLDDPVSRVQIRQALDKPAPVAWWSRWWTHWATWTAAASAVAAVFLIVAVTRTHPPEPIQHYAAVPSSQPVPVPPPAKVESDAELRKPAAARVSPYSAHSVSKQAFRPPPELAENARKDEPGPAPAAPPPPVALTAPQQQSQFGVQSPVVNGAPSQSRNSDTQAQNQQAVGGAVNSLRDQQQSPTNTSQFNVAVSGALLKSALEPVRYTLLKRDATGTYHPLAAGTELQPGDMVRLTVTPPRSGFLLLSKLSPSGEWTRIFPESGLNLPVNANAVYTIPDKPIEVGGADQMLQLTLQPSMNIDAGTVSRAKTKLAPLKKEQGSNTPLVVYFTIGAKKAP